MADAIDRFLFRAAGWRGVGPVADWILEKRGTVPMDQPEPPSSSYAGWKEHIKEMATVHGGKIPQDQREATLEAWSNLYHAEGAHWRNAIARTQHGGTWANLNQSAANDQRHDATPYRQHVRDEAEKGAAARLDADPFVQQVRARVAQHQKLAAEIGYPDLTKTQAGGNNYYDGDSKAAWGEHIREMETVHGRKQLTPAEARDRHQVGHNAVQRANSLARAHNPAPAAPKRSQGQQQTREPGLGIER